jgi:hypothetical protein
VTDEMQYLTQAGLALGSCALHKAFCDSECMDCLWYMLPAPAGMSVLMRKASVCSPKTAPYFVQAILSGGMHVIYRRVCCTVLPPPVAAVSSVSCLLSACVAQRLCFA